MKCLAFLRFIVEQGLVAWRTTYPHNKSGTSAQADLKEVSLDASVFIALSTMASPITGVFLVPILIVVEKEKHTLQAILVSPARPIEIALGKTLTGLVYSMLTVAALIALNQGWTGDWLVSIVAILMGALAMVALGLIAGSVCHTSTQVKT
ncbi:MAG: hypothetical protein GFH27_549361n17 [Chloroflexi bacterium AL-W]|nr:hypothetical protein [Chloroflexi bacterium AL-N1]NOK70729.1 hypothetical protein [Chloroflexi bacterium AL-N10]NOK78289.1 hypothetical protein [Chloroflexi bacterium AL-N5]NOK85632.1 hypothetical protein [Chloroflexi bacterium AL-W]NOK92546.1 hypothetical protein [Chloroflexi bacterium AL-N15]